MKKYVELKELVGTHILDAVCFSREDVKDEWGDYRDSNVMSFRLDGIVYTAIENPIDGYRSCMRKLSAEDGVDIDNVFAPVEVIARHRRKGEHNSEEDDVLEVLDAKTGKAVIEVGTDYMDDYYPYFVAAFDPTAMAINQ